jgi:hypothetical protein
VGGEYDKAQQVWLSLKQAEAAEAKDALAGLNGLIGLVQSIGGDQSIEIGELRASAFIAICELGKALHRGQPTGQLWTIAMDATERWRAAAK